MQQVECVYLCHHALIIRTGRPESSTMASHDNEDEQEVDSDKMTIVIVTALL